MVKPLAQDVQALAPVQTLQLDPQEAQEPFMKYVPVAHVIHWPFDTLKPAAQVPQEVVLPAVQVVQLLTVHCDRRFPVKHKSKIQNISNLISNF